MTRTRGSVCGGHWTLVVVVAATVGYAGYLQVQTNYARNEAVASARELAEPVVDLCRDDPTARRRLGTVTCRRAAEVAAPTTTSLFDDLVGRDVLTLLVALPGH